MQRSPTRRHGAAEGTVKNRASIVSDCAGRTVGVRADVASRVSALARLSLFRNSFFLLLRSFVTYAMGFLFWLVVARSYPEATVGFAAAILSTLLLLARGSALGLPTGILRFLPGERDKTGLINATFTVSAISALAIGLGFLAGVQLWAPSLAFVQRDPLLAVTLLVALLFFTLDGVVDNAFVAARRADYGLVRISIFYGLRIPFAFFLAFAGVLGILSSMTVSLVISVFAAAMLLPKFFPGYRPYPTLRGIHKQEIMGFSLWSFAGGLVGGAATFLMPLVVLNTLGPVTGPASSGHFYAAYTIATFLYAVPNAFSTSLLVEGAHPGTNFTKDVRRTVRYSAPLLALGIAGAVLLGQPLLALFGEAYSIESYGTLILLALASPIMLASSVLATHLRVAKRVRPVFYIATVSTVIELAFAYTSMPYLGILGAGVGVVAGQATTLVLLVAERLLRHRFRPPVEQPA